MTVYILGGGPAGLALADGLTRESTAPFTVIERSSTLGGLAQTVDWKDYGAHDLGPHKIFTLDKDLLERIKALIPAKDWLTRPKQSRIFMNGHYLPYPPSPFSLLGVYGPLHFAKLVADYGLSKVKAVIGNPEPKTFRDDLIQRVGTGLYQALFEPIAKKLWGDPADLDVKLSKGRVQTPSLGEVISRLIKSNAKSNFEALEFIYPQGGLRRLWNSIENRTKNNGSYLLNTEVESLMVLEGKIRKITVTDKKTGDRKEIQVGPEDMVFSSLPLGIIVNLLGNAISAETKRVAAEVVTLNDLYLVFFKIKENALLNDSWVFIPDPKVAFHRISEQKAFDPSMTPHGSIVCCEIMNNPLKNLQGCSDEDLCRMAREGLKTMRLPNVTIEDQRVIRLPRSYPVFRPNFESGLKSILNELDGISNFRSIGRQGAFNYIGTLDAMDIGYGAATWYARASGSALEGSWAQERQRTSFYPVLD